MPSPPGRLPHDDAPEKAIADEAEEIRRLLERGGPSARDEHGQTALHLAARLGMIGTLRQLLATGAEVDARDHDGNTPLHRAVQAGWREAAQVLIAEGADVNAQTGFGHRPLHLAAGARHEKLAELLVAHGSDVEAPIAGGRRSRPLHLAAEAGLPRLAALLLRRGADKNATNAEGQTPLDLAEGDGLPAGVLHEGHAAIAALLRQRGAARGSSPDERESSSPRGFRARMSGPGRNGRAAGH